MQLVVMNGVIKGTIAIEQFMDINNLGATGYTINGKLIEGNAQIGSGVNINDLGLLDSTKEIASPWVDWVCGSAVRQGIPAKLVKLA